MNSHHRGDVTKRFDVNVSALPKASRPTWFHAEKSSSVGGCQDRERPGFVMLRSRATSPSHVVGGKYVHIPQRPAGV